MQRLPRYNISYKISEEIQVLIHYTRDLRFDDRPDYGFLKRLIKTMAEREKIEFDFNFDWIARKNDVYILYLIIRKRMRKMK